MLRRFATNTRGVTTAEFALLLAIIGASIALAALSLGHALACSLDRSATVVAGDKVKANPQRGKSDPKGKAIGHQRNC